MLKKILLILLGALVLFLVVGFFLPRDYVVSRTVRISAPPQRIYDHVADLKTWKDWSAWSTKTDPDATWSYEGPAKGAGASMSWDGPVLETGTMTITQGDAARGMAYDLIFNEGQYESSGNFAFATKAGNPETRVTWTNSGELPGGNPLNGYLAMVMDKLLGPQFDEGLQGLKARVEAGAAGDAAGALEAAAGAEEAAGSDG